MSLFVFALWQLIKDGKNYFQVLESSLGRMGARAMAALYAVWGILLTAVQMRYYAQRVASTIYTDIGMDVFLIVLVFICVFVLKKGLHVLARMNEIFLPVIAVLSVALLSFLTPDIELKTLVPVDDWQSLIHVSVFNAASLGYLTFILFFVDQINAKEAFRKYALLSVAAVTLFTVWLFVTVIGTLGPHIIEKLPYPFFAVVKQISLGEFLQHIEAFVITLWILSDFVLISFIGAAVIKLFGGITKSKETGEFVYPVFVLASSFVSKMGRTNYELEALSEKIFIPANLIFLFLIPLTVLCVYKIRQKIIAHNGKNVV